MLALSGCSARTVTESDIHDYQESSWSDGQRPWYVGRQIRPGVFEPAAGADHALIFAMGDGYQGFPGSISGLGSSDRKIADVIRSCSREDMHIQDLYHGFAVVLRSSDGDRDTVECVRRFANRRFSVGYGRADIMHPDDTRPFREFENQAN
jgi:hypothetical protein